MAKQQGNLNLANEIERIARALKHQRQRLTESRLIIVQAEIERMQQIVVEQASSLERLNQEAHTQVERGRITSQTTPTDFDALMDRLAAAEVRPTQAQLDAAVTARNARADITPIGLAALQAELAQLRIEIAREQGLHQIDRQLLQQFNVFGGVARIVKFINDAAVVQQLKNYPN